jgi:HPt (histidine-containing phosphotransfer) domain-containing protein
MRSFTGLLFFVALLWPYRGWSEPFPVALSGSGLAYWIEEQPLSLDELLQLPPGTMKETQSFRPSLGFSSRVHWFRVHVRNGGDQETPFIFEIAYPRLELIDFYAVDELGQLLFQSKVGTQLPQKLRPINHINFAFPLTIPAGATLSVYAKVSTDSPIRFPVKVWEPEAFREAQQDALMLNGLYFGGIGIMVFYNMFVFLSTRSLSYLFYSLFVVCVGVYVGGEGGMLLRYFFTDSAFWSNKITLMSIVGANVSGLLFVDYFMNLSGNDPIIHRLMRIMIVPLLLSFVLVFVLPYNVVGISYTVLSAFTSGLLITTTARGVLRKQREAYFYAAAWISLLLGIIVFALMSLGFINSNFIVEKSVQIGALFEVTILSFALADRLHQLRMGLKQVNDQLAYQIEHVEEEVMRKTRDIRSIMEHIPLGVFSITADQSIHKDYSRSVESLFHRNHIAGEAALTVLFDHALLSADRKDQIRAALTHSIGEDLLNFELNRQVLVEQMVTDWEGEKRIYSLSWNPVCEDDQRVEKVLVTVHDSTRLLALESEAEAQRRDLAIIKKILEVPPARFHSFLRQAGHLLDECDELHILKMNLHTLKGTARSLDFDDVADLCHQLEDSSQQLSFPELKQQVAKLKETIAQYRSIAVEKLGRRLGVKEAVELPLEAIHGLIEDLTQGTRKQLRTLEKAAFLPLEEVLAQSLKAAQRLANELCKASPRISIEANGIGVTQYGHDALSGALSHLVRNSLDHGLETAEARMRKGKDPKGSLQVRAFILDGECHLDFSDDGAGLDLDALRAKGQKLGLLGPTASAQDIAELIFVPELSTREIVSAISGRGLGLSAVRDTLRKEGGDIALILGEATGRLRAFRLRLRLPQRDWIQFQGEALALSA